MQQSDVRAACSLAASTAVAWLRAHLKDDELWGEQQGELLVQIVAVLEETVLVAFVEAIPVHCRLCIQPLDSMWCHLIRL